MKTGCTAPDGSVKAIGDVIYEELGEKYIIASRILNFKNYGSNSSRTRTVVIGVNREMAEYVSPIELYPAYVEEKVLEVLSAICRNLNGERFVQAIFTMHLEHIQRE